MRQYAGPRSKLRNFFLTFLLIVAATLIPLALLEVGLRVTNRRMLFPRMFVEDPHTVYRLMPDVRAHVVSAGYLDYRYTVNREGLRATGRTIVPKPDSVRRVLAVGDSFTFGVGVDDHQTYPARLEARLRTWCDSRYEVVNGGVGGFGTSQELAFLDHYGWKLEPDIVVLGFLTSDPEDNSLTGLHRLVDGALHEIPPSERPGWGLVRAHRIVPFYDLLSSHSVLFNWVRHQIGRVAYARAQAKERGRVTETTSQAETPDAIASERWRLTEALLSTVASRARGRDSQLFVAIIPHGGTLADLYASGSDEDLDHMAATCGRLDLDCIDVAAWIKQRHPAAEPQSFYLREGHFTPGGYDLVAEAVAVRMAKALRCPRAPLAAAPFPSDSSPARLAGITSTFP